jgi:hypothetical protein
MDPNNVLVAAVGLKALGNELEKLIPHITSIQDHVIAQVVQSIGDVRRTLLDDVRTVIREEVASFRDEFAGLRAEVSGLRAEVSGLRAEVSGLRADFLSLRNDMAGLRADLGLVNSNLDLQVNGVHKAIALSENRSAARILNSHVRDPGAPLAPLDTKEGLVPYDFPDSISGLRAMDRKQLQAVLSTYELDHTGDTPVLLSRLARFIGVRLV